MRRPPGLIPRLVLLSPAVRFALRGASRLAKRSIEWIDYGAEGEKEA